MSLIEKLTLLFLKPIVRKKSRRSLPQLDGTLNMDDLAEGVKIYRDQWGIPHIYGGNLNDTAFAQGYVHAQDRLWQMEINRRVSRGQLSEVIGKSTLATDRASRILGFERLAAADLEAMPEDLRNALDSYTKGVNAFLQANLQKLPPEFGLLKIVPRPWEAVDSLAFARLLAWQMNYAWYGELVRGKIIEKVGEEMARELDIHYSELNPVGLLQGQEANLLMEDGLLEAFKGPFIQAKGGSNGWVIAGSRSRNGSPILCNDPHLPLLQPAIWYENHLICPEMHVTGVSLPGVPLVMIGHNNDIGWGMTLAFTDNQDIFIEKFTDASLLHYEFKNEVRQSTIVAETIKIKGQEDHTEKVVITHHGPVISGMVASGDFKLSLASKALGPSTMMEGWYQLNRAAGWNDFVGAVKKITAPSLNIPYTDNKGNIGYYVSGEVPIRSSGDGSRPSPGWTGDYEWKGNVPFEKMPYAFNPVKGYIVTCNHKIISDNYPYNLGNAWMNGYRANRLEKLIAEKEKFSFEEMIAWQMDVYCTPGPLFAAHLKGLRLDDLRLESMKQLLLNWDGKLTTESVAGALYETTKFYLFNRLFETKLGHDLMLGLRGGTFNPNLLPQGEFYGHDTSMLLRMLDNAESLWLKEMGGKEQLLTLALKDAYDYLSEKLGPEMSEWQWGKLHKAEFHHTLAQKTPLNKVFNQVEFSLPGDTDTLYQTAPMAHDPRGHNIVAPSFRQVLDPKKWEASICIMPPGQSGNILSPHYNDQLPLWREGKYHPMLWNEADVIAKKQHLLELLPKVGIASPTPGNSLLTNN
jgi:penicillin amidase